MFFTFAQLGIDPDYLHEHFDCIQLRFRREKKFEPQVLANLHLFREKNLQSAFASIESLGRLIAWRIGSIILYRETHWKSPIGSSFKISDPVTGLSSFFCCSHLASHDRI